jgi:hypothetical protein
MPKFSRVLDHIHVRSRATLPRHLLESLEQWERLATPEELERFFGQAGLKKAA